MAPLTRAAGPTGTFGGLTSINHARPSSTNEPEVVMIDDDDDEPVDEEEESGVEYDDEMEDEESENESADANGTESVLDLGSVRGDRVTPELFTSAGAQQALHPLRRTADRVTRQIEAFAEKLDRFKQKGSRGDDFGNFQAAYQLVKSYQTFAQDAIQDISKQHTLKRAKMGWNATRANGIPQPDPKTEEELQRLQLEANTWQLLLNLISIDDPASRASSKQAQETAFQKLHRYSSDREIWEQFLGADHYALECVVIMKWLEHTAKTGIQDIDSLIADLEKQSERAASGTYGWMYTKETIKGQKRLRAWPQPLEPNDPGITLSLLSSAKSEPLITQLDPDAVTRQKQSLQPQDKFYERATWMTCWKMLRQGESWTKIRDWAEERLENWRAVSLCGSSVDINSGGDKTPVDDGTTRMMNSRSQDSWRAACSTLARTSNIEDFERAVYGLLCGETEAAFKVCSSWDDYLYVYFNGVILSRYQGFCKQLQRKLSHSPTSSVVFTPEPAGYSDLNKFLQYAKGNDLIGNEARNPYRTIQAAILGKSYDSFFFSLARAVSQVAASKSENSSFVPDLTPGSVDGALLIAAQDEDSLRIATHLYLIARSIGYVRSDTQFFETASVNVIGYIANLEEAGIYDTIPIYASLLPQHLTHSVLGQILIEIVDPRERRQQVRLMDKHGINIEAVLEDQWQWVCSNVSAIDDSKTVKRYPKLVQRKDGYQELVPVRVDYIGTFVSGEDERMIRSLEWLRHVDGQWPKICEYGALLYRRFYITGKLAAARELSRRMRLSDISQESFGFDIAFPVEEDGIESATPEPASPTKSRLPGSAHKRSRSNGLPSDAQQALLYEQSQNMRDLEELILAFDALEMFAIVWENLEKNKRRRDSGAIMELRQGLQEALDEIAYHVDAMLDEWLIQAKDDAEKAELEEIRNTYIPEVFLDYHSALYYSAHVLSAELLVQCMNLAMQVSENEHLTRSFIASKRMAEIVDALALSSKAMVNARSKPGKRLLGGESLGIWNVEVEEEEESEMVGEAK
ncbi:Nucleoporin nup84 [Aspergillus wentii]|nr:Nucleoporin nup84 [Aspergillus wentii]